MDLSVQNVEIARIVVLVCRATMISKLSYFNMRWSMLQIAVFALHATR